MCPSSLFDTFLGQIEGVPQRRNITRAPLGDGLLEFGFSASNALTSCPGSLEWSCFALWVLAFVEQLLWQMLQLPEQLSSAPGNSCATDTPFIDAQRVVWWHGSGTTGCHYFLRLLSIMASCDPFIRLRKIVRKYPDSSLLSFPACWLVPLALPKGSVTESLRRARDDLK